MVIAGIARSWLCRLGVQATAKEITNTVVKEMLDAHEIMVGSIDEESGFVPDESLSGEFVTKTSKLWDETGMKCTAEGGFWIDATEIGRALGDTYVQDFNKDHPELPGHMD